MRGLGVMIGVVGVVLVAGCGGNGDATKDLMETSDVHSDGAGEVAADSRVAVDAADVVAPADISADAHVPDGTTPELIDVTADMSLDAGTDVPGDLPAELEAGCQPQCQDKDCGDDGCGGECGPCPAGQICSEDQCVYPTGPQPLWNTAFGGSGVALAADLAADGAGNVYVCGTFIVAAVDFGEGPVNNKGGEDLFLVKLDAAGELLWAKAMGGTDKDFCRGLSGDGSGGVFMVGGFASSNLDLGGGVLANGGGTDILLARFDGDGEHLWSKSYGIEEDEAAWAAATGADGSLHVTGRFGGQYSSTMKMGEIELTSNDKADIFVARIEGDGTPVWAKGFGGTNVAHGREISVSGDGRVAVAGEFFNAGLPFEYGGSEETTLGMGWNVFLLVLDSDGVQLWAKTFGANGDDSVRGVALDDQNNVAIAGHGKGTPTLDFGQGPVQFIGNEDLFVARFDGDGTPLWAKLLGSNGGNTAAASLASNGAGDLYLSSHFDGANLDLGGKVVGTSGGSDILLLRYTPDGEMTWSAAYGTPSNETGAAIALQPSGALTVAGGFEGGTMEFGLEPVTNSVVATPAVFVAGLEEK